MILPEIMDSSLIRFSFVRSPHNFQEEFDRVKRDHSPCADHDDES